MCFAPQIFYIFVFQVIIAAYDQIADIRAEIAIR